MMTRPIKVKHKTYRSRNPLPAGVWVLILLFLCGGYFLGGVISSIGEKNEREKTQRYFRNLKNDLPA